MFQALYEIERTAKELELSMDEIRMMREEEPYRCSMTFMSAAKAIRDGAAEDSFG